MTGWARECPVCGAPRTRRSNWRRGTTCGAPPCQQARKAAGGRASKGRRKPGNAHAWAVWRARQGQR